MRKISTHKFFDFYNRKRDLTNFFVMIGFTVHYSGAPNENIVQNRLNIALLNVIYFLNGIFLFPKNFSSVRIS